MYRFLAILLILIVSEANSQNNPLYVSGSFQYGIMARHSPSMRYIVKENALVSEISFIKRVSGKEPWHATHKYPWLGGGLYYADLGNPEVIGKAFAVYGFIIKPIIEKSRWSFNYKVSTGISYLNRPFDAKENYLNTVIGSALNVYFFLGYEIRYKISNRLNLNHGIGFTHYSNGSWSKPNLGFNLIGLHTGIQYKLKNKEDKIQKNVPPEFTKSNEINIQKAFGLNEQSDGELRKYFVSSLAIDYLRNMSAKRKIGFGLDFFYSEALDNLSLEPNQAKKMHRLRIGSHVSFEVVFNNAIFYLHLGYYVFNKYPVFGGELYDRVGFKWFVYKNLFSSISLKTHFAKAEFIEWGFGIKL